MLFADDQALPIGSDADEANGHAEEMLQIAHVELALLGQIGEATHLRGGRLPALQGVVLHLYAVPVGGESRGLGELSAIDTVADTDFDLVKGVEHVQLGQGDPEIGS